LKPEGHEGPQEAVALPGFERTKLQGPGQHGKWAQVLWMDSLLAGCAAIPVLRLAFLAMGWQGRQSAAVALVATFA